MLLINLPDASLAGQGRQMLTQLSAAEAQTPEEAEGRSWARAWQAEQQLSVRGDGTEAKPTDADCGRAATQLLIDALNGSSAVRTQPYLHRMLRTRGEELAVSQSACGKAASQDIWRASAELGVLQAEYQRPKGPLSPLVGPSRPFWHEHAKTCSDDDKVALPGLAALATTITALEGAAPTVIAEFEALKEAAGYEADREQLTVDGGWSQLFLYRSGVRQAGCEALPATCELTHQLQRLRLPAPAPGDEEQEEAYAAAMDGLMGDVKLSRMRGGTEVIPHCGPTNQRLRLQLALGGVSPHSYIEVGQERRQWEQGRALVFDDSFEHRVATDGDAGVRTVLIVDLWHPGIPDLALERSLRSCAPLLFPSSPTAAVRGAQWSQCEEWRLCTTAACLQAASQCSAPCLSLYASVAEGCAGTVWFAKAKRAEEVLAECGLWRRWA